MYKIALDDGHGTNTAGKQTPSGYKENYFNHWTKEYLKAELIYNGFYIIDCSPSRDDNSLYNRVQIERENDADIFVSIHFNAMGNNWQTNIGGIETYYHDGSKNGLKLAEFVHEELLKGTDLRDRGVKKDTVLYTNGLYVLRMTYSPAILVECGFMDNRNEAALMKSIAYRKECSKEIAKGICNYFGTTYKNKDEVITEAKINYIVQCGAFSNLDNAEKLSDLLSKAKFDNIIKEI